MRYQSQISPVIVNYRTPQLVLTCVRSLIAQGIALAENIVVVDNASGDDSVPLLRRELPGVRIIDSGRNDGFSAGVNIGAAAATQKYLLVLNPDTWFADQSMVQALDLLETQQDIGLVGLELIYPDGQPQYSARRFYSVLDIVARRTPLQHHWPLRGRIDRHLMKAEWQQGKPFDAEWVMGTGFIIRRQLFEQIGRMDEAYFLYMEDVDLCARVWHAGYRVVCVPGARLVHDHQRASKSGPFSWAGRMHLQSLRVFRRRYRIPLFFPPGVKAIRR